MPSDHQATEISAATKQPVQLPLIVTGCGRTGTKYTAFALRRMGLDVRHERLGRRHIVLDHGSQD